MALTHSNMPWSLNANCKDVYNEFFMRPIENNAFNAMRNIKTQNNVEWCVLLVKERNIRTRHVCSKMDIMPFGQYHHHYTMKITIKNYVRVWWFNIFCQLFQNLGWHFYIYGKPLIKKWTKNLLLSFQFVRTKKSLGTKWKAKNLNVKFRVAHVARVPLANVCVFVYQIRSDQWMWPICSRFRI